MSSKIVCMLSCVEANTKDDGSFNSSGAMKFVSQSIAAEVEERNRETESSSTLESDRTYCRHRQG